MLRKYTLLTLSVLAAIIAFAPPAAAQDRPGLFDGVTAGAGITTFFGEVDRVIGINPIRHLAQSNLHLLVGVDRDIPPVRVGLEGNYQRFTGTEDTFGDAGDSFLEVRADVFSLDVILSYGLNLIREDYFRIYAGAGPTLVNPAYELSGTFEHDGRVYDREDLEAGEFETDQWSLHLAPARVILTTPVGVMIDDRLRLGVRVTWTDYLDGARFKGSYWDYLANLTFGWRFGV